VRRAGSPWRSAETEDSGTAVWRAARSLGQVMFFRPHLSHNGFEDRRIPTLTSTSVHRHRENRLFRPSAFAHVRQGLSLDVVRMLYNGHSHVKIKARPSAAWYSTLGEPDQRLPAFWSEVTFLLRHSGALREWLPPGSSKYLRTRRRLHRRGRRAVAPCAPAYRSHASGWMRSRGASGSWKLACNSP
jgi:hypothetical protein